MISGGGGKETPVPTPPDRPGTVRPRLDGVPLRWRRAVLLGVLIALLAAAYLALVGLHRMLFGGPVDWTAPLPGMVGGVIGTAAVVCLQRRPLGATLTRAELDRALRDGRLPEDADPELWALVLGDELADLRGRQTAGLATVVVLAGSAVGLALVVDPPWVGMALTAGLLVLGGLLLQATRRRERRIRRLLDRMTSEAPSAG